MCIHTECILANYVQFVSSAFSQSTSLGGLKPVNYIIMWNDVGAVVYDQFHEEISDKVRYYFIVLLQ